MALISIQQIAPDVTLGLWRIEEDTELFCGQYPHLRTVADELTYRSESRKRERLAVQALLYELFHDEAVRISHTLAGKPLLSNGWQISISHTRGYAAVIVSEKKFVAVDIEYFSNRVGKIAPRFIRKDEQAPDITAQLLNWSAKETAYKYYSADDLQYFEMRVTALKEGLLRVENLRRHTEIDVCCRVTAAYVLTYCHGT